MKIFDTARIKEADATTVIRQGITSFDLMERAGREVFTWLKNRFPDKEVLFHIFSGKGNNGGDGLVIARLLAKDGYAVRLEIIGTENAGNDFATALRKINEAGITYNTSEPIGFDNAKVVIVDALFGTGLSRMPEGDYAAAIEGISKSEAFIVSVDVPSGMFMEQKTTLAVKADIVLALQFPKLALYMPGNREYSRKIEVLDIGLDKEYIKETAANHYFTDKFDAHSRYRPVAPYTHKGMQGHALIIGGSYGKGGAAMLSAKAALTSGCGLVTAYIPSCNYNAIQSAFPEAMVLTGGQDHITSISFDIEPAAIGIGPGLGQHDETQRAFHDFLKLQQAPIVLDADALNILSYNKEWLKMLPENSVITPHPKELERLIGVCEDDFERLERLKRFSEAHNIVIVAKDAHTMVVYKENIYINSSGNAALATAGSGDVLTGMITGLMAQGYSSVDAAVFGVYLHGLTADIAKKDIGIQAFTASSILKYMGKAYLKVEAECRGQ